MCDCKTPIVGIVPSSYRPLPPTMDWRRSNSPIFAATQNSPFSRVGTWVVQKMRDDVWDT